MACESTLARIETSSALSRQIIICIGWPQGTCKGSCNTLCTNRLGFIFCLIDYEWTTLHHATVSVIGLFCDILSWIFQHFDWGEYCFCKVAVAYIHRIKYFHYSKILFEIHPRGRWSSQSLLCLIPQRRRLKEASLYLHLFVCFHVIISYLC